MPGFVFFILICFTYEAFVTCSNFEVAEISKVGYTKSSKWCAIDSRSYKLDLPVGDDDGPLVSSSPYSRMEFNSETPTSLLRFPDDRSDSGVSSLRSGSGDERSGSRSSALSSSDEPNHTSSSSSSSGTSVQAIPAQNRSPLFIPAPSSSSSSASTAQQQQRHDTEPVRVWRDPNLLLEEPHVRHIQSVQHQVGQVSVSIFFFYIACGGRVVILKASVISTNHQMFQI